MDDKIVLQPIKAAEDDFSDKILAELISEGFEKENLIEEFKIRKELIRKATTDLRVEATSSYSTFEEVFSED